VRLFEWWSIPRRAWIIIVAELSVIIGLSSWAVSEYFNDIYFQSYVNNLAPILVPVVSVGFGVASASTATVLYFRMKNLSRIPEPTMEDEHEHRQRGQKRAARKIGPADTSSVRNQGAIAQASRLRPLIPGASPTGRSSTTSPSEKKESS
jgi:hypothetical protein